MTAPSIPMRISVDFEWKFRIVVLTARIGFGWRIVVIALLLQIELLSIDCRLPTVDENKIAHHKIWLSFSVPLMPRPRWMLTTRRRRRERNATQAHIFFSLNFISKPLNCIVKERSETCTYHKTAMAARRSHCHHHYVHDHANVNWKCECIQMIIIFSPVGRTGSHLLPA